MIHSPGVPVFRDDRGRLLDTPYTVGFLTSPAPNAGVIRSRTPEDAHRIPAVLASRAERVLEVAAVRGYRRLVLGAWGCGVFMNDPAEVVGAFRALLADGGRFMRPLRADRLRHPRPQPHSGHPYRVRPDVRPRGADVFVTLGRGSGGPPQRSR